MEVEELSGKQLYPRPKCCEFSSIASLYERYDEMFLSNGGILQSESGHKILCFDHHFFHLAAIGTSDSMRLFMAEEKATIMATVDGYGKYILDHKGSRARNLPSARATILSPDEVWGNCPSTTTAKWVYVKEFASKPYPFTVALLTSRPNEGGIIVPVSSFPCTRSDVRKWRRGVKLYCKTETATEWGG